MKNTKRITEFAGRDFAGWCFDKAVRVGVILHVGACHDGGSAIDAFRDLIDNNTDQELGDIFGFKSLAAYMKAQFEPDDQPSERERQFAVLQYLMEQNVWGFLVSIERAVRTYTKGGKSSTYSWGHYSQKFFYTTVFDATFISQIGKWVESVEKKEKAHAAAKGGAK